MRLPSLLDRGESRPASPFPETSGAHPVRGQDDAFSWLLTVAFLVSVGLVHALFIGVALYQSVEAIPIAHQSPQKVGMFAAAVLRMVTLIPAIFLLRAIHARWGFSGTIGSALRGAVALVAAGTFEWWLFLASMMLVDRLRGTDAMAFVPMYPYGITYRVVVLGIGMLFFTLGSQWRRLKSLELRAAEAEAALRTSELTRLEEQIQPHFLFNALTAVLACRHDPEAVARVTIGLSEHLRSCLSRQRTLEPLSREIDALEHYITVQRVRFGRRLDCRITASAETRDVPVPPVIIEPLLDNALKHGAKTSADPLRIVVDCRVEEGSLVISVENSGSWIEPGTQERRGTGLANLRKRLDLLDVRPVVLDVGPVVGGVRARLQLPLSPPDAERTHAVSIGGKR